MTAASLYRNHQHFCQVAKKNLFFGDYLRMLRHTEFGPWHAQYECVQPELADTADYWLNLWLHFAKNVLAWLDLDLSSPLLVSTDRHLDGSDVASWLRWIDSGVAPAADVARFPALRGESDVSGLFDPVLLEAATDVYHEIHDRYGCV